MQTTLRSIEPHARQNHIRLRASHPLFLHPLPPPPSRASASASARIARAHLASLRAWAVSARLHLRPLHLPLGAHPRRRRLPCVPQAGNRTCFQEAQVVQDGRSTSATMCESSRSVSRVCSGISVKSTGSRACGLALSSVAASPARARTTGLLLGECCFMSYLEWSFPLLVAVRLKFHDVIARKVKTGTMGNTRFSTRSRIFPTSLRLQ